MEQLSSFLTQLKDNNNREWFEAHKPEFKKAQDAFSQVVSASIQEISRQAMPLGDLKPGDCIFRVYRDVRFSPDKRPYKTHMAAIVGPGGRKGHDGVYFHFDPEKVFMAFGIYEPEPDQLKALRKELDYNLDAFLHLANEPKFKAFWGEAAGEKLKTVPKGYSSDNQAIEYLKFKQLYFEQEFKPGVFQLDSFPKLIAEAFQLAQPMWSYLKKAIGRDK